MSDLTSTNSIEELVALSRRYGSDPAYCLAGGGNTSLKSGNRLWVKASGQALSAITASGFVEMDRSVLKGMLSHHYAEDVSQRETDFMEGLMKARIHPQNGQRPSIEVLIHELIPRRYVVHTHPGVVNALTCCVEGEAIAKAWLFHSVIWQPYVDPGVSLAQSLHDRIRGIAAELGPIVILLENHGLIVAADTVQDLDQVTKELIEIIHHRIEMTSSRGFSGRVFPHSPQCLDVHQRIAQHLMPDRVIMSDRSDEIRALTSSDGGKAAALSGPLTPDQIVYCRAFPMWIDSPAETSLQADAQWREGLDRYEAKHGGRPWVVLLAGAGMIAACESSGLARTTCDVYRDAAFVYRHAVSLGGVQPMGVRDTAFIENWEVESYRRAMTAKSMTLSTQLNTRASSISIEEV